MQLASAAAELTRRVSESQGAAETVEQLRARLAEMEGARGSSAAPSTSAAAASAPPEFASPALLSALLASAAAAGYGSLGAPPHRSNAGREAFTTSAAPQQPVTLFAFPASGSGVATSYAAPFPRGSAPPPLGAAALVAAALAGNGSISSSSPLGAPEGSLYGLAPPRTPRTSLLLPPADSAGVAPTGRQQQSLPSRAPPAVPSPPSALPLPVAPAAAGSDLQRQQQQPGSRPASTAALVSGDLYDIPAAVAAVAASAGSPGSPPLARVPSVSSGLASARGVNPPLTSSSLSLTGVSPQSARAALPPALPPRTLLSEPAPDYFSAPSAASSSEPPLASVLTSSLPSSHAP